MGDTNVPEKNVGSQKSSFKWGSETGSRLHGLKDPMHSLLKTLLNDYLYIKQEATAQNVQIKMYTHCHQNLCSNNKILPGSMKDML